MKIGVPLDRLHILPLNERIDIAGVTVTFLDANHCPGSVIILFEPPNGKVSSTGHLSKGDNLSFLSELIPTFV